MPHLDRRAFLAASAAATAAAFAPGARVLGANERVRVGVIGFRNRGNQVCDAMLRSGLFDIAAVCDCDSAMIGRGMGEVAAPFPQAPRIERDFRRLLEAPDIDAVVVATPDHWHACMTVLALDAGKHVYCEKPASHNLGDGARMLAAAREKSGLVCGAGTQQRSGPHFIEARAFIQGGGLGKIGFARAWIVQNRGRLEAVPDTPPPDSLDYEMWVGPAPFHPYNEHRCHYEWHWVRDFGTGEMGNWGAHWIDIARWYLGVGWPIAASGAGGQYVTRDTKEWPDTQTVIYQYPDLTLLWEQRIWTEYKYGGEGSGCEFIGEKGALTISRGGWTFHPHEGRKERHPGSEMEVAHVTGFANAIRGIAPFAAPIDEACISAGLCHLGNLAVQFNARLGVDAAGAIADHAEAAAASVRPWRAPWDAVRA